MESVQKMPILVREDGRRFVPVEGFHRLEAGLSLDEETGTRQSQVIGRSTTRHAGAPPKARRRPSPAHRN